MTDKLKSLPLILKWLSLVCLLVPNLGACGLLPTEASTPRQGDLDRSADFRGKLQSFLSARSLDSTASGVDAGRLPNWTSRSLALTADIYQKKIRDPYVSLGSPSDELATRCASNMDTPVWYSNYDVRTEALNREKNRLALTSGSCTHLQQAANTVIVGLYQFQEPLSSQVPSSERAGRLTEALKHFVVGAHRQSDSKIWEANGILVGEGLGYLYTSVPGLIPHSTKEEKHENNYYRLVLVMERAVAAIDVYARPTASVEEMQAAVWPVVQALQVRR